MNSQGFVIVLMLLRRYVIGYFEGILPKRTLSAMRKHGGLGPIGIDLLKEWINC